MRRAMLCIRFYSFMRSVCAALEYYSLNYLYVSDVRESLPDTQHDLLTLCRSIEQNSITDCAPSNSRRRSATQFND